MRVAERGFCRGNGRMYNGQYRPSKFSIELRERIASCESRVVFLKTRIAEEQAIGRGTAVGTLARELALEEKILVHLRNSAAEEEARERGELLDTPHWED
jgi:hypothetical protein